MREGNRERLDHRSMEEYSLFERHWERIQFTCVAAITRWVSRRCAVLYEREAKGSVEEVTRRVQESTKANGFGVIVVINLKEKMEAKGVEFEPECRIIEVCNPEQAKKVLETNIAISTVLPCRISVYGQEGKVKVATLKPTAMLGLFNDPELLPAAQVVEETIIRIIDSVCA